ncbi:MAG: hypothetical protein CEN92_76 [Candidatus Berkelbacteria bacterium Licking1014_96]|uniref:Uncharacterized protein n=1 Tax=Candidatus Berkelbacteria bacterium Licking1014_96 TaxID=2017149 RepID=A0A554LH29_9BACT|nr:MAG: hypothetical protein CEN92_76 [Candidatus Berkelbacteria bacterium Licking1014_96]
MRPQSRTRVHTDGVLFAFGRMIYYWDPLIGEPFEVVERPGIVTSIAYSHNWQGQPRIWDACRDGKVRIDLGEEIEAEMDWPIGCLAFIDEHDLESEKWLKKPILFLIPEIAREEGTKITFHDLRGDVVAQIKTRTNYEYDQSSDPQVVICEGGLFWACGWSTVFRGFSTKAADGSFLASNLLLAPTVGRHNFLIAHCHNDSTHPEGVIVSTRDKRVLLTYNHRDFGFPRVAGCFRIREEQRLFLVGGETENCGHGVAMIMTVCEVDLSPPIGQKVAPKVISRLIRPAEHCDYANPFLAESLADLRRFEALKEIMDEYHYR